MPPAFYSFTAACTVCVFLDLEFVCLFLRPEPT